MALPLGFGLSPILGCLPTVFHGSGDLSGNHHQFSEHSEVRRSRLIGWVLVFVVSRLLCAVGIN